jgi:hypothetical protein
MIVAVSSSGLKRGKWYEYLVRFALGGGVTVLAGILAKKFGPGFGGLFLAFPAILAASTTLVEKHERERKEQKGMGGMYRGRHAAGADAAGAAMGSFGLMAFAVIIWRLLPDHNSWLTIAAGTGLWAAVSAVVWSLWKGNVVHRLRVGMSAPLRTRQHR